MYAEQDSTIATQDSTIDYQKINTLVFEGGSVKGLAYVGALQTLDSYLAQGQKGFCLFDQIQHVAGTSAGSIMALLLALGLNLDQISIVMQETSFSSFADMSRYAYYGGNAGKGAAIYQNGYLCEGEAFMQWVKREIKSHTGNENITFAELKKAKGRDLHVYAVRLNDSEVVEFNAQNTPTVSVALAIRMSMSIPLFFKPVRVKEDFDKNGRLVNVTLDEAGTVYYVDGGVKANYPYPLIKKSQQLSDEHMLGFKVDSRNEIFETAARQGASQYLQPFVRERNKIEGGYGSHLMMHTLNALMSPQEDIHRSNPLEYTRTIYCWDADVSTFDFDLTKEKINALLAAGVGAARDFIEKHPIRTKESAPVLALTESLTEQLQQAMAVPEAESAFAMTYKDAEKTRIEPIIETAQKLLQAPNVSITKPEEDYLRGLVNDCAKIRDTVVVRGHVQEVRARHANVTQVSHDKSAEASQHLLQLIDKGVSIQREIAAGAQVGTISSEVGNLDGEVGFFKQHLIHTEFITEAETVLDAFDKHTSSTQPRATARLISELTQLLDQFDNHKQAVQGVKTSIEAIEQAKEQIQAKTRELQKVLEQQTQAAHPGTVSSTGFFSPAPTTHSTSTSSPLENTLGK